VHCVTLDEIFCSNSLPVHDVVLEVELVLDGVDSGARKGAALSVVIWELGMRVDAGVAVSLASVDAVTVDAAVEETV